MMEVLDSRFFAAHFYEHDPGIQRATREKLVRLRREGRGILPTIVIAEVANVLCRRSGRDTAKGHLRAMRNFGLTIVPLDEEIAGEAGMLRCEYRNLPTGDAIVASVALRMDGRVISDDHHFQQVRGLRVSWLD